MFTGIVATVGRVQSFVLNKSGARLSIETNGLDLADVTLGDSIAVNGVCLTAVKLTANSFVADVSGETLECTTLGKLKGNSKVNLEKALRLSDRLGGHLVSGHVDGIGEIVSRIDMAGVSQFKVSAPLKLAQYIAYKGSITIDGTSLTINGIADHIFELTIVPHTLSQTIMADYVVGTKVNIEVDLLARYLERLLLNKTSEDTRSASTSALSKEFLANCGYLHI
ncbi:UNVERIFIED_CONTAM: hypothetical protein GTU68_041422 [Idotea baltica]|nr:hypothetical protein [Idotea baltica]